MKISFYIAEKMHHCKKRQLTSSLQGQFYGSTPQFIERCIWSGIAIEKSREVISRKNRRVFFSNGAHSMYSLRADSMKRRPAPSDAALPEMPCFSSHSSRERPLPFTAEVLGRNPLKTGWSNFSKSGEGMWKANFISIISLLPSGVLCLFLSIMVKNFSISRASCFLLPIRNAELVQSLKNF